MECFGDFNSFRVGKVLGNYENIWKVVLGQISVCYFAVSVFSVLVWHANLLVWVTLAKTLGKGKLSRAVF